MKISQAFPSKWLRAADLDGSPMQLVVRSISIEDLAGNGRDEDRKPVIHFDGEAKGFGLNKTNANTIARAYGDDTDNWIGKAIELYPTETDYQGERVECIRVRTPKNGGGASSGTTRVQITRVQEQLNTRTNETVYLARTTAGEFGTTDKDIGSQLHNLDGSEVSIKWHKNAMGGRVIDACEPAEAQVHAPIDEDAIPF